MVHFQQLRYNLPLLTRPTLGQSHMGKQTGLVDASAYRALCLLAVISLLLAIAGCSGDPASEPEPIVSVAAPQNLLFIILDAFDAGHVSHLGYKEGITPNLDRLASEGVTFANAHSQTSSTNSSAKSYLTGMFPAALRSSQRMHALTESDYTMAEFFRDAGFRTAGFSENTFINERLGYAQGFEKFEYISPLHDKDEELGYKPRDQEATLRLIASAQEWLRSQRLDDRWFCYLHLLRPHNPYTVPESFARQEKFFSDGKSIDKMENRLLRGIRKPQVSVGQELTQLYIDRYDTNIRYVDHLLGELIEGLNAEGLLENTLLIVASDHGEAFGQHGEFGHNSTVYEEMIHVPLLFHAPESVGLVSSKVSHPVEMVDLFPTLADLFSLTPPQHLHGTSFLPLMLGRSTAHKDIYFSMTNKGEWLSVRKRNLKLISKRKAFSHFVPSEIFDIGKDPEEQINLLGPEGPGEVLSALTDWYREKYYTRAYQVVPEMSQEDLETLESLGYGK